MNVKKGTSTYTIDALFRAHYRELCVFGFRFIDDIEIVEDIVQDVFLHIITHHISFEEIHNPRAYLYTAVRNACTKQLKNHPFTSVESIPDASSLAHDSIEKSMIEVERTIQIYRAIDSLPQQCKNIFIRCQIDRLKYRETAEELNISVNSVKTQMKKAYRLLRHALRDIYDVASYILLLLFNSFF